MKIHFAADHAGFALKNELLAYAREELGLETEDHGAYAHNGEDDYNEFVKAAAVAVSAQPEDRGVIIGGSGQGEAIAANRIARVRAAVFYGGDLEIVKLSRQHNDANVLSLGARFVSLEEAKTALNLWLETPFSGEGRHERRNQKLDLL